MPSEGRVREKGSSPLTRGALAPLSEEPKPARLIPAYAGSTSPAFTSRSASRAHPRLRGEHVKSISKRVAWLRLIPAYAGSTHVCGFWVCCAEAHPRLRGEHTCAANAFDMQYGSSPLTRGALPVLAGRRRARRLIPAYAGSTKVQAFVSGVFPAHPRLRREHYVNAPFSTRERGSSPLTRGARRARIF